MKIILFLSLVTFNALAFSSSFESYGAREDYGPDVAECRKISFTIDRDECLFKIINEKQKNQPITKSKADFSYCQKLGMSYQKREKIVSSSSIGTGIALCILDKTGTSRD
ncbi:hypothetical protein [Janthinobacterium sp. B9-8]|uniref:hypothetical protein n=1 Tax=Janthinobacterium sp. B9-8 TaxID=1236179 RepID=UPI00061D325C|nr:hypothetical protein [Janthinobacterium sp. B9-8]AMC34229.1 hypothetical protein VN23_06280 [Janthinobacterium sp. B9-8]